jgi:CxxC motif-containing protein (DUF1111 family)
VPARRLFAPLAAALVVAACSPAGYGGYGDSGAAPGGDGTVDDYGPGAFSQPAANLTDEDVARFRIGDSFFTEPWVPTGPEANERDGLGPTFLAVSCAECHPADGRSSAPEGGTTSGAILRFVDSASMGTSLDGYRTQIQTRAVPGAIPEASIAVTWSEVHGEYGDGTPFALRRPEVVVSEAAFGSLDARVATGVRLGPPLIGLGLLEAIPVADIIALTDPDDQDGDGISGVAAVVDSPSLGPDSLGRFGWKANVASVADQTAIAYLLDLGITSPLLPTENCPAIQSGCAGLPSGGAPEISEERFAAVVAYAQTLAVPGRPSAGDATVQQGGALFDDIGCSSCHVAQWTTGAHPIEALSGQVIIPYTDLLLHDMGPELSDGRADGVAGPTEWRTAPLWGLGLTRTVNPRAGFLHDGRARSIEEAVLWHGGEALVSRDAFVALSAEDRQRVLVFLKSL